MVQWIIVIMWTCNTVLAKAVCIQIKRLRFLSRIIDVEFSLHKVETLWEGHKIWIKSLTCFDKTAVFTQQCQNKWDTFFQIFVAFSRKAGLYLPKDLSRRPWPSLTYHGSFDAKILKAIATPLHRVSVVYCNFLLKSSFSGKAKKNSKKSLTCFDTTEQKQLFCRNR